MGDIWEIMRDLCSFVWKENVIYAIIMYMFETKPCKMKSQKTVMQ